MSDGKRGSTPKRARVQRKRGPTQTATPGMEQSESPAVILQRLSMDPPPPLNPNDILSLQATIGNQAVQRLIQARQGQPARESIQLGRTTKAKEQNQEEIDLPFDERVYRLVDTLEITVDERILSMLGEGPYVDSFHTSFMKTANLLHGLVPGGAQQATLNAQYAKSCKSGRTLEAAIKDNFGDKWEQGFLLNILENGAPTPKYQLALSLGLITHGRFDRWVFRPGDPEEVIRILEESDWDKHPTELTEVFTKDSTFMSAFKRMERISSRIYKRILAFGVMRGMYADTELGKNIDLGDEEQVSDKKVEYLARIVRQYKGLTAFGGTERKKLFAEVKQWAAREDGKAKAKAVLDGSAFDKAIKSLVSWHRRVFEGYDVDYLKNLIKGTYASTDKSNKGAEWAEKLGIDAKELNKSSDERTKGLEALQKNEKQLKEAREKAVSQVKDASTVSSFVDSVEKEHQAGKAAKKQEESNTLIDELPTISALHAALERARVKFEERPLTDDWEHKWGAFRYKHTKLRALVEGMTDEQREHFLVTLLKTDQAKVYNDPTTEKKDKEELLSHARETLKGMLEATGMKGKYQRAIMVRFTIKGLGGELGSTYLALKAHLKDKEWYQSFCHRAYVLTTKLRGDEFRQVRDDKELLADLQAKLEKRGGKKEWGLIKQLLALDTPMEGEEPAERSASAIDIIEGRPEYWAMLIDREIDKHVVSSLATTRLSPIKEGRLWGYAQGAQMAARRLYPDNEAQQTDFVQKVFQHSDRKIWLAVHMRDLKRYLRKNKKITIEKRVKESRRNLKVHKTEISQAIQDLSGRELLDQLSNFPQFLAFWTARKELLKDKKKNKDALIENKQRIDSFIIDVNDDLIRRLGGRFMLGSLTGGRSKALIKILTEARKKLATAIAGDKEFRRAIIEGTEGMSEEDLPVMEQRMRALYVLDEERLSNRGVQWEDFSVKSMERQSAAWDYKGKHRTLTAHLEPLGGRFGLDPSSKDKEARKEVITKDTKEIKGAEEQWEKRQEAFEEMREKYNGRVKKAIEILLAVIIIIAVVGGSAAISYGGTLPFWFAAAMLSAAAIIGQKVIMKLVDTTLSGSFETTGLEAIQETMLTALEVAVAFAMGAVNQHVNMEWWKHVIPAEGMANWYMNDGGQLTGLGHLAEGGKTAAQGLVNQMVFGGLKDVARELMTQEDPFTLLRNSPGFALKQYLKGLTLPTILTFFNTMASNALQDQMLSEQKNAFHDNRGTRSDAGFFDGDVIKANLWSPGQPGPELHELRTYTALASGLDPLIARTTQFLLYKGTDQLGKGLKNLALNPSATTKSEPSTSEKLVVPEGKKEAKERAKAQKDAEKKPKEADDELEAGLDEAKQCVKVASETLTLAEDTDDSVKKVLAMKGETKQVPKRYRGARDEAERASADAKLAAKNATDLAVQAAQLLSNVEEAALQVAAETTGMDKSTAPNEAAKRIHNLMAKRATETVKKLVTAAEQQRDAARIAKAAADQALVKAALARAINPHVRKAKRAVSQIDLDIKEVKGLSGSEQDKGSDLAATIAQERLKAIRDLAREARETALNALSEDMAGNACEVADSLAAASKQIVRVLKKGKEPMQKKEGELDTLKKKLAPFQQLLLEAQTSQPKKGPSEKEVLMQPVLRELSQKKLPLRQSEKALVGGQTESKDKKGKSEKEKAHGKDAPKVKGIPNRGNTCFLNSALNTLAFTDTYYQAFRLARGKSRMAATVADLLKSIREGNPDGEALTAVIKYLQVGDHEERDVSEALFGRVEGGRGLIELLPEDIKQELVLYTRSTIDFGADLSGHQVLGGRNPKDHNPLDDQNQTHNDDQDPQILYPLHITKKGTFQQAIDHEFGNQAIPDGKYAYKGQVYEGAGTLSKQATQIPKAVTFRLTTGDHRGTGMQVQQIYRPTRADLQIPNWLLIGNTVYRLKVVVYKHGQQDKGHYTTDTFQEGEGWRRRNDSLVGEPTPTRASFEGAYLCTFEQLDPQPNDVPHSDIAIIPAI